MNTASLFVKEKGPILTEYLRTRKKLSDAVAGRGFSFEPGFMYDAQNNLEIDLKGQLSALNYKLLEQAITQELKQSGLDYDLAFKNAMIAWESDKQTLISAWDNELSMARQAKAQDEEALNILSVELGRRAITLMDAKTAIELEAEGYRLQIEQLGDQSADYEVLLAEAKLRTAEKKLEVIPYLQQLIDIETQIVGLENEIADRQAQFPDKIQELIGKETVLVDQEQQIANKEQEIITEEGVLLGKQQELLVEQSRVVDAQTELLAAETIAVNLRESLVRPALTLLVAKMDEYVAELAVQLALYEDIADAKTETIGVKEEIAAKQAELIVQKRLLSDATSVLIGLTEELISWKVGYLGESLSSLIAVLTEYGNWELEQQITLKTQIAGIRKDIELLAADKVAGEIDVDAAEVLYEQQKNLLAAAELAIKNLQSQNELLRIKQDETNLAAYAGKLAETEASIITEKENAVNTVIGYAEDEHDQKQSSRVAAQTTLTAEQIAAIVREGRSEENKAEAMAQIEIDSQDVTAQLTHLLKQD